jgi:hypothetical protein
MPAEVIAFPHSHLRPYDPDAVGAAIGVDRPVLPQGRCMEDRPEEPVDTQTGNEGSSVPNLWVPGSTPGERTVHLELAANVQSQVAKFHSVAHPMMQVAQENGLSLPGGLWGITIARPLGMEMTRPGSFVELGEPVDVIASIVARIVPELGRLHADCKARLAAHGILTYLVSEPDTALATALETAPWTNRSDFGKLVDAAGRLLDSGLLRDAYPAPAPLRDLIKREDDASQVVAHAGQHVIAIDNRQGDRVIWDTRAAWAAGEPAYALNVGLYGEVAETANRQLNTYLGDVATEHFVTAVIGYQAATIQNLPKRPDGLPPQVVYINDAAGAAA